MNAPRKKFEVGDKVVKNPANWKPNEFDSWGRGLGVGIVVEPPFQLDNNETEVRWPKGRCFEDTEGLLHAPDNAK
jgi:hypothetical protein